MLKFQKFGFACIASRFEEAGYFIQNQREVFLTRIPIILNCGLKQYGTKNHSKNKAN